MEKRIVSNRLQSGVLQTIATLIKVAMRKHNFEILIVSIPRTEVWDVLKLITDNALKIILTLPHLLYMESTVVIVGHGGDKEELRLEGVRFLALLRKEHVPLDAARTVGNFVSRRSFNPNFRCALAEGGWWIGFPHGASNELELMRLAQVFDGTGMHSVPLTFCLAVLTGKTV